MHITVAGKQVETGEALKTHVRDGLNTIARKYFDHALEANVTFRRDRSFFACDINLKAGRGLLMRGEGEGADAHRAFEVAAEHVAKRLRRYRRRVNDHARNQAENRAETETATQYVLQPEEEEASASEDEAETVNGHTLDGTPDRSLIVAEQATEIARLSVGEAVMRLDLAQLTVLMFRNSGSGTLNVVYRRPDGRVGWIDTPAA
jgi:ribosomal subunit interface protein